MNGLEYRIQHRHKGSSQRSETYRRRKESNLRRLRQGSTKEKLLPRVKRQALWTTPIVIEGDSGSIDGKMVG